MQNSALFNILQRSVGLQGAPETMSESPHAPMPAAPTPGMGSPLFQALIAANQPSPTPRPATPGEREMADAMRKRFGGITK